MSGDLSIFREVATQLEKTNSVGWDASYKSVQTAQQNLGAPDTKVFLSECFQPIITILLEQHPSRIEMHQRSCIDKCLYSASPLLYQLLKDEQDDFFATLLIVLDDRRTFYKGGAVKYWNHMPGAPEVRMKCIQTFAQKGGFDEVVRVLQRKGCKWLGAENSRILLQATLEARNCIRDEAILTSLAGSVMDPLTQLNEEDLKKESTESMSSLITVIRRLAEAEDSSAFFEFWLKLTLTYIQSKALPLRLFAWDQVVNIIEAARKARPPARRYLVKGAGVDHVNGIYDYIGDRNTAPGYQHDCGNGVVLTLFRCQMRSRSKWWFISEADKDQPGTDKDVDYYQHRSTIHQEQEPSATGWISCNTQAAKGKDPPPTLERLEPLVEQGKENDTLEHQLMRWVLENRIVEDVFGASMHREVVNRSGAVLKFLSMMKGLTHSHLDMIWKACVGQTEAEAVEEIHTVLASLITCLEPALVVHLVETVRASLKNAFAESIALIEKLAALAFADVAAQGAEVLDALSGLLWDVLQHPLIREHKAKTVIREFFKSALQRLPEKQRQYAFLGHCLDAIRASASAITEPDYDESEALNALRMAQFLLEVFPPAQLAETMENLAEHQHLPDLLFLELAAFKGRCVLRARLPPSTPRLDFKPVDHAERIKLRLNMLRYVHSGSETLKLTFQRLTQIWDVLNGPKERELFFVFLLESCNTNANLEPHAFSLEVMGQVFQVIMCQEADWHILDDRAYNAFRQYFAAVRKWPDSMYSTVGVNALWRIGLTARTQTVAEAATRDLLAFYGEGDVAAGDGSSTQAGARGVDLRFLRQIFQHLAACRDELRAGVSDSAGVDTTLKAERCLRLLQGAVATSRMHGWSPSHLIPHGVRGQSGRRPWTVEPRRILPQSAVGGANKSQLMKLEPFQLSMHPLETVGVLRRRIATRCEHPVASVKLISGGKHLQKDDVVLDTLNSPDRAEVQAVLMLQPQVPQQQGATPPLAAAVLNADDSAMAVEPPVAPAGPAGELVQVAPQAASVGEVIANAEEYCNILFDLLETTTGEPPAFAGVIWEVLLAIPTEARALELVRLAAQKVDAETQTSHEGNGRTVIPAGWPALISPTHWHRSVYFMQILDAMLQPSEDVLACEGILLMPPQDFLRAFVGTGGFAHILEIFMRTGVDQGRAGPGGGEAAVVQGMATACALHIVKFCMFGERGAQIAPSPRSESHMPVDGDEGVVAGSPGDPVQLLGGSRRVRPLLDRLVQVIHQTHSRAMRGSAADGEWQVTVDALATLEMLLSCAGADLVPVLISNLAVQQLIVDILLRNPTPRVRDQMRQLVLTEAAPDLSRSVFTLCLGVLEQLEPHCSTCHEFFTAVQALSRLMPATDDPAADSDSQKASLLMRGLARLVAGRLTSFPRPGDNAERQQAVLTGLLTLLLELVKRDADGRLFKGTELEHMVDRAFDDLLFAVPSLHNKTYRPICPLRDWKTRQLVFLALLELVRQRHSELSYLVKKIDDFARRGSADLRNRWSYECSYEAKTYPGQYVGLRNQGCTCYMNSLLQNLFMIPQLRNAVLHARIKQRKVIPGSEVSDDALTGLRISVRWSSGQRAEATVQEYDSKHGTHTIKYDGNGADSEVTLELRKGREGRETGEFDVVPAPTRCTPQIVLERQQTQRVLEQMQRTFCYLQSSEKRYFDPRMLVEACKCLNLQYSVYQQNDASEFCDKLLDKLEASLKGTPQLHDLNTVFGGKQVYQKIPQGCEHRDEKEEPFIRLELIIRGKDSIQESLSSFVEGEMMDGENKVECEGCGTKKPTIRRVCLGQLPNVLVLHLKRFDLDYSTFETVKLNNHCAFPMRLNVKPYTREGLEEAARAAATAAAMEAVQQGGGADGAAGDVAAPSTAPGQSTIPSALQVEDGTAPEPMMLDDGEYDYELKGVVIHAGVAQGGHYYSYIKDRQKGREDLWYKFDDEDVTVFDPAHIEAQCFGGTTMKTTTWQGVTNTVEQDRVSNALMLFYEKVRPRMPAPAPEPAPATEPASMPTPPVVDPLGTSDGGAGEGDRMDVGPDKANAAVEPPWLPLVECQETDDFEFGRDGCSAFDEEVWQANVSFIQHCYLFDHQFQAFLSGLLSLVFHPVTPSEDDGPQPPLPPPPTRAPAFTSTVNVDPLLANPCRPRWDPLAPEIAPLRMDVLRMGVLFLLDVILHSRDRPGLSAWAAHIRHAFSVEPEAAPWVLSVFSQPGGYWLRSFFLECSDSTARMWGLQLLDEAVTVVASGEDEAVVLTDPSLTVAEAASRSPVAAVLERAVSLLEDVNRHWRHVDELFCLYRDVARHSEAARSFLVRCDLVYKLTMLVVGDRAPPALLKDLPKEWIAEAQTHHHADFLYLLEAVATLVGVPQMQKVPLLEETDDRGFASEYKLTHPVRQALTTIFNENSRNGGMSMQDIMKYLDRCNGSPQVPNFQIKNMLSKYDTLPDGRLSVTGFLAYYRDTAVYQMKQVWQDLHAHGFRNDLSRATSASVDYDMVDLSSLPPLRLPQRSELAITLLDFYTTMFDVLQPETCGILTRVCQENLEISRRVLGQVLGEISRWVDSWNTSSAARDIEILLTMIQVILSIADAYKEDRAYFVHWSEYGLCMCIVKKAQRWSDGHSGGWKQQMDYYANTLLQNVLNKHPESRQQAERRGEWWQWICTTYGPSYGGWGDRSGHGSGFSYSSKRRGSYGDSDDDESSNPDGAMRVSGAGNPTINGVFKFCRVSRNSNIYERTTTVGGAATTYTLYRCELEDRHHRWYISVVPSGREPGTREDQDFYFCPADPTVPYPPQKGWRFVDDQWAPPPTVQPADDDSDDEADAGSGPPTPSNVSPTGSEGDSMDPSPPREDGEDGYGSMEGGAVDAEGEDL